MMGEGVGVRELVAVLKDELGDTFDEKMVKHEQVSTKIGKPNKMGNAITFYFQRSFSRTIKLSKHLNTVGLT